MEIKEKRLLFRKYIISRYGKYYNEEKEKNHIISLKQGFYAGIKAMEKINNPDKQQHHNRPHIP